MVREMPAQDPAKGRLTPLYIGLTLGIECGRDAAGGLGDQVTIQVHGGRDRLMAASLWPNGQDRGLFLNREA